MIEKPARSSRLLAIGMAVCLLTGSADADLVLFDLAADSGQWTLTATVSSSTLGLAGFNIVLDGVDSAAIEAPAISISGIPFGGFSLQDVSTSGSTTTLTSLQNLINPPNIIYGVGVPGEPTTAMIGGSTASWEYPVVLATGTYSGVLPSIFTGGESFATVLTNVPPPPSSEDLQGDFDGDGDVDGDDFLTGGDYDNDGDSDFVDLLGWQSEYGTNAPGLTGPFARAVIIPEANAFLAVGCVALLIGAGHWLREFLIARSRN